MNPIKATIKTEILPILFVGISLLASGFFYKNFPEQVPTHWNFQGEVDAYSSRWVAAFLFPLVIAATYVLFLFIPRLDPKKERYAQFKKVYHIFKFLLIAFFTLIYFLASFSALGSDLRIEKWLPLLVGLLFIVLGNYLSKIKPNWFMGIRTPWTLSSEDNWRMTHRFSSKVFVLAGIAMMSEIFVPSAWRGLVFGAIIVFLLFGSVGYSLYYYLKNKPDGDK